ncbi:MAG TPA: DUF4410 domain-containing protein [Acidobacteriaceae bacterium]|nr:DUF4410 domain-containing protein [Acidobacteriaceae bacterium]
MNVFVSTLVFSLALGGAVAYGQATASGAPSTQPKPTQALILPFAVANNATATPGPSGDACPKPPDPNNDLADTDTQKLIETISTELQKKLGKKMTARVGAPGDDTATGTLIVAGCLTTVDPGNAAKRMAGMNLGASHLGAHVVAKMKTADGLVLVKEFDATAKGSKVMPPIGPVGVATHAAAERRETLNADAKRLAGEIAKNLSTKAAN